MSTWRIKQTQEDLKLELEQRKLDIKEYVLENDEHCEEELDLLLTELELTYKMCVRYQLDLLEEQVNGVFMKQLKYFCLLCDLFATFIFSWQAIFVIGMLTIMFYCVKYGFVYLVDKFRNKIGKLMN